MSQKSNKPMERSEAVKFGFFMLRGVLYVGNTLTVGLLCFAAQILFYMLCFLVAIALFMLVAIVLPAAFVIIGFLIESPELALIGIIVALIAWGVMLACAACANRGQRGPLEIDSDTMNGIKQVGEHIMIPWRYFNQRIGMVGKSNNQEQDNVNADKTDLKVEPMNDYGFCSKITGVNPNKNENNLKMSNETAEEIINGQK